MLLRQLVLGHGGKTGHARFGCQQVATVAVQALVAHVVAGGQLAGGGIDQRAEVHARGVARRSGQRGQPFDALLRTSAARTYQGSQARATCCRRVELRQFAQCRDPGQAGAEDIFLNGAHPRRQRVQVVQLRGAASMQPLDPGDQRRLCRRILGQTGHQAFGIGQRQAQAVGKAGQRIEGAAAFGRQRAVHLVQRIQE